MRESVEEVWMNFVKHLVELDLTLIETMDRLGGETSANDAYLKVYRSAKEFRNALLDQDITFFQSPHEIIAAIDEPVSIYGVPNLLRIVGGEDVPVYDSFKRTVRSEWRHAVAELPEDRGTELYRHVYEQCKDYGGEKDFIRFREQLGSGDFSCLLKRRNVEGLVEQLPLPVRSFAIETFFMELPATIREVGICQMCGQVLNVRGDGSMEACVGKRCNVESPTKVKLEEFTRYWMVNDWTMRFIRRPGIEERRIEEKTRAILNGVSRYTVEVHPDYDRVDLAICERGERKIQADVKDVSNPWSLVKFLNEQYSDLNVKLGGLNMVYIVIPQDIIRKKSNGYVEWVEAYINPSLKPYLSIYSEAKWYNLVRSLCPEEVEG
ncbi:hypothetical protein M662_16350 [Bacillus sp. SB49]|uniref:restriction endonuclease-related protein n=1 Tax=Bacillus sp. SB49 TaxID=1071080 RepID=UPI00040BA4FC|nr:hypothetical protein [Bacillus sp. SB49]QHT47986.1 hypothetical protein M662_16350 [Bacillus sp. SB49]